MDTSILSTIITAGTTLVISIGTWHFSAKAARKKEQEELKDMIEGYRGELHNKMDSLEKSVTAVNASVQQQIAMIDYKIEELSGRVEKHNNVVERTYALEKKADVQAEQIRVANHRIEDLEQGARNG